MTLKNIILLTLGVFSIALLNFFCSQPIFPIDILQGQSPEGFYIEFPLLRYFIEPFYAFVFYILTLERAAYMPSLISWSAWIILFAALFGFLKKHSPQKIILNTIYCLIFFASLLAFAAVLPIPGPKLIKPNGFLAFDAHSHTNYSHDNVSTIFFSRAFHRWAGFDGYYISEHNNSLSFEHFPEKEQFNFVYPAVQMQSSEGGVSVLLLSQKKFDAKEFQNLTVEDLIHKAHQNNMLAIMPHWWKWRKHTLAQLKEWGIDGFEIYNCGYRNIDEETRKTLIDFTKENNLLAIGSTDWHGWGYMTDVWTVTAGDKKQNLSFELAEIPPLKVILYRQEKPRSMVRFIFEPFSAFYFYLKSADLKMTAAFILWIVILFVFFHTKISKKFLEELPLIFAALFAAFAVYFLIIFLPVYRLNRILFFSVIPASAGMSLLWLIFWKTNKVLKTS
ncbi:MAG: hypothetical protein LBH29_02605 [Elusimicrobiota bacterium]|jgi:predicted metal-dependent phosphoesterase TrpH|nr:hypothetical protein [Elusimicrobiota bacterium]